MTDRLPPHDIQAEEATIASLLLDSSYLPLLNLSPDDFYYPQNGTIYQAMLDLKESGSAIDQITVAQRLHQQKKLEEIGGAAQLSHLISQCPTPLDCQDYANIVKRMSVFRQMIGVSDQISSMGYSADKDTTEALAKADHLILNLRKNSGGNTLITPTDRAQMAYDRYARLYGIGAGIAVKTGLADFDKILGGGFFPGELNILAGRPGMGKSAMARHLSNVISGNSNVLFCSGEMGVGDITDRDIAGILKISTDEIRKGDYGEELYGDIVEKIPLLGDYNVYFTSTGKDFTFTTASIYQTTYEMFNRHGLGLVVIDYLGLIKDRVGDNRNENLGYITSNLKEMARELDIPVLLLHQLSRALEHRPDRKPQLHDLRESGHVEEDADNVIFLYRDDYYYKTPEEWFKAYPGKDYPKGIVEVIVAKHRQGEPNRCNVLFQKPTQAYVSLAKEGQEQMV